MENEYVTYSILLHTVREITGCLMLTKLLIAFFFLNINKTVMISIFVKLEILTPTEYDNLYLCHL